MRANLLPTIVAGDREVDETKRRISISKSNNRDIHVRTLSDRLVVCSRVSDEQNSRLHESVLNLICEGTRCESSSNVLTAGHFSVKENLKYVPRGILACGKGKARNISRKTGKWGKGNGAVPRRGERKRHSSQQTQGIGGRFQIGLIQAVP